jgi:phospholipid-binding lipoprotein MlaA
VDRRSNLLNVIDEIYATSLDPYATIRSAFLQQRRAAVKNTHEDVPRGQE